MSLCASAAAVWTVRYGDSRAVSARLRRAAFSASPVTRRRRAVRFRGDIGVRPSRLRRRGRWCARRGRRRAAGDGGRPAGPTSPGCEEGCGRWRAVRRSTGGRTHHRARRSPQPRSRRGNLRPSDVEEDRVVGVVADRHVPDMIRRPYAAQRLDGGDPFSCTKPAPDPQPVRPSSRRHQGSAPTDRSPDAWVGSKSTPRARERGQGLPKLHTPSASVAGVGAAGCSATSTTVPSGWTLMFQGVGQAGSTARVRTGRPARAFEAAADAQGEAGLTSCRGTSPVHCGRSSSGPAGGA